MLIDPFADFDASPYLATPVLPLQTLIVLGKALGARVPADAGGRVEKRAARLAEGVEGAEQAMVVRLRQDNKITAKAAMRLDNAVDGLWALLRQRLGGWVAYEREGLAFLDEDEQLEIDMDTVRQRCARAKVLTVRLFGERGLELIHRPFPEQAQLMANLLELIQADELEPELLVLTGEELLPILRRCQARYEQMVQDRAGADLSPLTDLRRQRGKLQRLIVRYSTAVLGILDEDEPETREVVEDALRPMINLRPRRSSGAEEDGDEDDQDDAEPEAELAALAAEA